MLVPLLVAGVVLAPSPKPDLAKLDEQVTAISKRFRGRLGFHLLRLDTGESIGYRDNERFPSASTIKTALMVEAVRQIEAGSLKWSDKVPVPPKKERNASMWVNFLEEGISVDIDGLVHLMMNVSDNTATVMLGRKLDPNRIESTLLTLGLTETVYTSTPPPENKRLNDMRVVYQNMGVTTPREMGTLLELIHRRKAASPAGCEKMLRIMAHQYWDDFIAASVPPEVTVCAKVGALNRSRSDTAIVYGRIPYILSIYTDSQKDQTWTNGNEGNVAIRRISSLVWNTLHPERRYVPPAGAELWYPTGGGVE